MVLYSSSLFRWLQLKRYQYEVTFSMYMMTPTEKFILNSILFLILSLVIIAASLYLPEHIATIAQRASFYWGGVESQAGTSEAATTAGLWAKTIAPTAVHSAVRAVGEL